MSESYQFKRPAPPVPDPADEEPEYNPHARLDYLNTVNPRKKKRVWLRVLVGLIVVALLVGAGLFAYPHIFKKHAAAPATSKQQQTKQSPAKTEPKVVTKHFDSTTFNLGFEYPSDWVANENPQTNRLTVTSPVSSQKTASGQTELVRTIVTIAPKGQNLAAFDKGSGLAVRASEKIKYLSPTSAQRAETYLTFVQYSTTAAGSGLDALYITGDNGYQKDQYIPKTDMTGLDPVISVMFEHCVDTSCSATPASASIASTVWDTSSFKTPILTLLTSLSVN